MSGIKKDDSRIQKFSVDVDKRNKELETKLMDKVKKE